MNLLSNIARHGALAILAALLALPSHALQTAGGGALVTVFASLDNHASRGDGIDDAAVGHLGLNPEALDSDGDGIPDWWEIRHGLDPLDPNDGALDLDGGGLTNLEDYLHGTSPWMRDTTGNGWWDAFEVAWGSDPSDPSDYPRTTVYADVNADGRVDATDVQLVVNAALGIAVPVPAKVNGVGGVNAVDVQEVINAALSR